MDCKRSANRLGGWRRTRRAAGERMVERTGQAPVSAWLARPASLWAAGHLTPVQLHGIDNNGFKWRAEVAELADALASGASARKGLRVRLPSSALPFAIPITSFDL